VKAVAVLGASGYVGSHLVPRLVAEGYRVRAIARRRDVLEGRGWAGVDLVEADALRPETLPAAFEGVNILYYLVHSMGGGRGFAERDRQAAANVREAAAAAGVERIIYLGGLAPAGEPSEHLRSRLETGDVLRGGPVPVTELRAGLIVGPGSAGFEIIRDLVYHLPAMVAPRWVQSRTRFIALNDLLAYLVAVAAIPETAGRTFDVAGAETLRYRDLLTQFAEVVGKRRLILPVPLLSVRLSSYWLGLVTTVPAAVARPLIEGLRHDMLADDRAIRELVPIELHTYREAVEDALRIEREQGLPARWAEGALAYRGWNPEVSFYSRGERVEVPVAAPASDTWHAVATIGGRRGYYSADILWQLRGLLDRLVGGVGLRRGRRHPVQLRVGDAVDFWRVAAVEPGRRLVLVAEMRLPGSAVLEFEVEPTGEHTSKLIMTARFHPSGLWGLLYWFSVLPLHGFIFRRMPRNMGRFAERRAAARAAHGSRPA
jgi:uncharacterized protein YbjT (DUF2867 family)